ncbi:hypothetical protein [Sphingomonas sp. GV3]|uniref:hypothetical protein n=1 Tax=Sphingomonas sp. GV3 TaxID=3040671 RepID=UPI00280B06DA|nr:hypothetical protein [Sphingomonas sp. GV3]
MIAVPQAIVAAEPGEKIDLRVRREPSCAAEASGDDVIVCGKRDNEQYRLRPLPPPPETPGLLSRPLRMQIAPGVSFGFQRGGGFGFKAELGPGKKTDDAGK